MIKHARDRLGWLVVFVLFAGSVVNYADRAALSVVMPQMRRDLGLSNADYGWAVNAFLVLYMIFYIAGGRLADRFGCRRTFTLTVAWWSVANMLHALASGLASLCLFRALLGIGEGGYYPAALRGISEWFGKENRAKAVGILLCGLSVGALLAPPVVAAVTLRFGWRAAFLVTGSLGMLLIPPWLLVHRRIRRLYGSSDPAPAHALEDLVEAGQEETPLSFVLRSRKYWFILSARALTDGAWYFYLFWMPGYFQEIRHFDLAMVGQLLWIPYFSADIGSLAGAWASSALVRMGMSLDSGRKAVLVPSAALAAIGGITYFTPTPFAGIAILSAALFGHLSWASNIHTVIAEISPNRHRAVLYGITGAAGTMMGAVTQPLVGRAVDLGGYSSVFACASLAYLVAVILLFSAGPIEPVRRPQRLRKFNPAAQAAG